MILTKEQRLAIAMKYTELCSDMTMESLLNGALHDELLYIYVKCGGWDAKKEVLLKEFQKAVEAYTLDGFNINQSVFNRISHYLKESPPPGHFDLNDCVSYFGVYYDGRPTKELRKSGRYIIKPLFP